MINNKEICERIRRIRVEKRMSQETLAHKVGYNTRGAISRIENAEYVLTTDKVASFADALGVSIEYLLFGTDDIGSTQNAIIEKVTSMSEDEKQKLLQFIDLMFNK